MTAPTPAQFLAMPSDPYDEATPPTCCDGDERGTCCPGPAEDFAAWPGLVWGNPEQHPLVRPLQDIAERLEWIARGPAAAETEIERLRDDMTLFIDANATLGVLVEEIEAIVKPSTSKLANSVRAAVERWRNPMRSVEVPTLPLGEVVVEEPEVPPHDADVAVWRTYAEGLGHLVDGMNKSQIRTLLGIAQPTA